MSKRRGSTQDDGRIPVRARRLLRRGSSLLRAGRRGTRLRPGERAGRSGQGGGSRGYGAAGGGYGQQPPPSNRRNSLRAATGRPEAMAPRRHPPAGGGGGRRGYGQGGQGGGGSRGRAASDAAPRYPSASPANPPGYSAPDYSADPAQTRLQEPADAPAGVPTPRRSRLDERRASRGGDAASQNRSDQYPESALNGRSTRNGAAARSRARAGDRPNGPVRKTGYHRYFDYPRTGKYGWQRWAAVHQADRRRLPGLHLPGARLHRLRVRDGADPRPALVGVRAVLDVHVRRRHDPVRGGRQHRPAARPYSQIPMPIQNAVVSQEDKTFWSNPGVSYTGTSAPSWST